jgi:hypothetical protein
MRSDTALSRVASGEAWEQFCDRLKEAGQIALQQDRPARQTVLKAGASDLCFEFAIFAGACRGWRRVT